MKKRHPAPAMELPISLEIYQKLLAVSCDSGFEQEDWEIAASAIQEWVARHCPDSIAMPSTRGYQWKHVFLPNGTLLRTVFNGKNHHCLVDDDALIYNGARTSPSRFVNLVGGVRRNAWQVTWILLPKAETWKLAATLRPSRSRKLAAKLPVASHL